MKNLFFVIAAIILTGCSSQKKYTDFDISYSRSGGFAPIYENLLIKGTYAHYSFEGQNKKIKKDFKISAEELEEIQNVLSANSFRKIGEDYKKVYDNISTTINVKKGDNSGLKTDASFILEKDRKKWENITGVFCRLIDNKINDSSEK
ncbi:hypothetical protein [Chryseobacterium sp.]|uniref:hypothetical protein n=1 Tax=Chryseobacterium sp. TaxID=1871047 RepID=UPI0011C974BA|nr:hypothetical protein [Chryseobacterium sp.]TXF77600.1 hypothetical protein FUA25_06635 [Chryseobacterium sp.]